MKTFDFVIDFICANTGTFKSIIKEYKAPSYEEARIGISKYLEDNKTIAAVLSCICINS